MLIDGAPAVKLADVDVAGTYQLGGSTEPVVWGLYKPPDLEGTSPELPEGQVHTMFLPVGCQVFVATATGANMDSNISLWLVWPGALPLQSL